MKDKTGPAFPTKQPMQGAFGTVVRENRGMTLRQYYAGQALAGYRASGDFARSMDHDLVAEHCWKAADALIAGSRRAE